ncbi:uncharacterized protein LOC124166672 isoform X1 [Ischnura elegans]|uniref:uncharacterized protein LOC124166672 isoform X1 n=1 Tax=Ischnura elegans TaxID=197161 RepID=UPI001ED8B6C1|nr:uncharacterized protein LOC124166672 isoform X1 [Ischnura elegans]
MAKLLIPMLAAVGLVLLCSDLIAAVSDGMMRKSIVFDKATPDVFYCPQQKPTRLGNGKGKGGQGMLVRARPLSKLCEFDGKLPLPADYKSDCYKDIDETDFACKEKKRIMKRLVKRDDPLDAESAEMLAQE